MNRYNAIGRLTKDIEDRVLPNGTQAATFDLAVSSNYADKDGKYRTNFIKCKVFGNTASVLVKYTHKGSKIGIEGEIQTGSYEAQDGTKRYTTEVLISKAELLDKKEDTTETKTEEKQKTDPYQEFADEIELNGLELPF